MRWALLVEYHGGGFVGWQRQGELISVQKVLEEAAAHLTGGRPVASIAAGRTDSGVHAVGQVVMLDLPDHLDEKQVRDALNFHMRPHLVVIRAARPAPPNWNPRFSAVARSYRYRILNRATRPALDAGLVWHLPRALDVAAMASAAKLLIGWHDFTTFRASACQAASPWRTLDRLDVTATGDYIDIHAQARSFLHHQVRNMVGTLKLVGDGHWTTPDVSHALTARSRAAGGPTAPPDGLCLLAVRYAADPFGGGCS